MMSQLNVLLNWTPMPWHVNDKMIILLTDHTHSFSLSLSLSSDYFHFYIHTCLFKEYFHQSNPFIVASNGVIRFNSRIKLRDQTTHVPNTHSLDYQMFILLCFYLCVCVFAQLPAVSHLAASFIVISKQVENRKSDHSPLYWPSRTQPGGDRYFVSLSPSCFAFLRLASPRFFSPLPCFFPPLPRLSCCPCHALLSTIYTSAAVASSISCILSRHAHRLCWVEALRMLAQSIIATARVRFYLSNATWKLI